MTCAAHGLAHTRGFLLGEDVDLIRSLAAKIRPRKADPIPVVVDVGAGSGTTALSVFAELEHGRVRVYSYDTSEANKDWAALAVANIGRTADWRPVVIPENWFPAPDEDIPCPNLVLIDGDHSYDGVMSDFWWWAPRMLPPYLIWFHDYHVAANEAGSRKAIDELIEQGHLTVIKTAGFGIAGRVTLVG